MSLSLVVLTQGPNEGKVIPVRTSPFLVGRSPQCHLRPASPVISQRHCAMLLRGTQTFVCDLASANGTFVNDERIHGEVELHHRDRLRVGPLAFEVRLRVATPVSRPSPLPPTQQGQGGASVEDVAAEVLLGLPDVERAAPGSISLDDEGVPTGGTVLDPRPAAGAAEDKGRSKEGDAKDAARAMLGKYLRRHRT
jgi:pSer/pThr/pTyr-binding forkhead associated (FHA) protein